MLGRIAQFIQDAAENARRGRAPASYDWDLSPDDRCVVNVTRESVVCSRPDGIREAIAWPDLQRVEIEAGDGTWGRNIHWVLHDSHQACHVPHGSVGEMSLMASLQALPEWDNGAILAALRSQGDFRYECWRKDTGWRRPHWGRREPSY
jgi:hypothetical protein